MVNTPSQLKMHNTLQSSPSDFALMQLNTQNNHRTFLKQGVFSLTFNNKERQNVLWGERQGG